MRIYLCTDMEGISGISYPDEFMTDGPRYEYGRTLLTGDVAAAVEGLKAGGATKIVVLDGHGGGNNLVFDRLPAGAEYVCGRGGSPRALPFLDESYDAVGMIGQHAMAGTPDATWPHTQSSASWLGMWVNGREIGEIGQFAIAAGGYGLPLVLFTGDRAACSEVRELVGDQVENVAVKHAVSATRAKCIALDDARHAIFEAAKRSIDRIETAKPFRVDLPMEVKVRFNATKFADDREKNGADRVDLLTVRRITSDPSGVYAV